LAILAIAAVDVPVYTTQARDQIEYILSNAGARAIFVSSPFLAAAREIKRNSPQLEFIICLDRLPAGDFQTIDSPHDDGVDTATQSERPQRSAETADEPSNLEAPGHYQDWGAVLLDFDQVMADGRAEQVRSPGLYDRLRGTASPDDLASQ